MSQAASHQDDEDQILIDAWIAHLRATGAAPGTLRLYRNSLLRLTELGPLRRLTVEDLEGHLWQEGGSARTVNNRIAAFRSFYDHLVSLKRRDDNPARRLERRPVEDTQPDPLDDPDEAFDRLDDESRAMAVFLLETGLEVSEALSVDVAPPAPEEITVASRGGKSRTIFLTPEAREALDALGGRIKIGARALQRRFDRFGFSPRRLRQTLAQQLKDSDVDPWTIQQILGHKLPQAARSFATYSREAQRTAYDKRRSMLARRRRDASSPSGESGTSSQSQEVSNEWFGRIYLEEAQRELLSWMVEGERQLPTEKHGRFLLTETMGGSFLIHPYVPERPAVRRGDLESLADYGLLRRGFGSRGTPNFEITPQGRRYYTEMKRRVSEPMSTVEEEMRRLLVSDAFESKHPEALARWRDAESDLWAAETVGDFTEIGHICREAMQAFADSLARLHRIEGIPTDPSKTIARIRAVIRGSGLAGGRQDLLTGLLSYWGTVSDFVQRQEHGAGKEGEDVNWEDARRAVFQTMVVMFEIERALG